MNKQLQSIVVVLFVILILLGITLFFWIPSNRNDYDKVVVAKEETYQKSLHKTAGSAEKQGQDEIEIITEPPEKTTPADIATESPESTKQAFSTTMSTSQSKTQKRQALPIQNMISKENHRKTTYDIMGNQRNHVTDYTVKKNDWLSSITGKYWGDVFMWPDLYTLNKGNLGEKDPDLIHLGEKISIYESLTADGDFSEQDRRTLLRAYLQVYTTYKQIGESKSQVAVQILAAALRYDKNFLNQYHSAILSEDISAAKRIHAEQVLLD